MKLIAMVMVGPGEENRYLHSCLAHLREFCDEIRVRLETDDPGWEGTRWDGQIQVQARPPTFFQHEGHARQELLEWTMEGEPTHILAIDADEFVADGAKLRATMEAEPSVGVWRLAMTEIWGANEAALQVRTDGKWPPRPIGIAFEVPQDRHVNRQKRRHWRIPPSPGACGRVPILTQAAVNRTTGAAVTEILHLGWACKADRQKRYERYAHTDGFGHDNRHIESIMYGDDRVTVRPMAWPPSLDKATLLERVNRESS